MTDPSRIPQTAPRATRPRTTPLIQLPSGSHTGGSCQGCGKPLGYWIHYKLCDVCIQIAAGGAYTSYEPMSDAPSVGIPLGQSGDVSVTHRRITTTTGFGKG